MLDDDKPMADVADQQRLVRPEDTDDPDGLELDDVTEADPVDVADQRRVVPVSTDEEPWP